MIKLSYQQQLAFDTIMHYFLNNHDERIFVFSGVAGCVDSETEFLTPTGWKKISEWDGEHVMQYNLDGTSEFVIPNEYIKKPCNDFYHLKTKYGIDQMLSEEHRILYRSKKTGKIDTIQMKDMYDKNCKAKNNWRGQFLTTFRPIIDSKLNISDEELRVQVALMADGSFRKQNSEKNRTVFVRIKKKRKQERLEKLLNDACIEFNVKNVEPEGFKLYTFKAPIKTKVYDERFWKCSNDQLRIICDEVLHWDGNLKHKQYFSTIKEDADFIQYAFSSIDKRSTIYLDKRDNRNTCYTVIVTDRKYVTLFNRKEKNIEIKKSTDGYKYCFSVPSTYLVLRRNNRIFITGNSGKSTIINELNKLLRNEFHMGVANIALTGKAANVMAKKGVPKSQTIHRYMYIPIVDSNGNLVRFQRKDMDDFTNDFIIIDESSMVTENIFEDLWNLGKKMLFVGDINQLPPVSKSGFNIMDMAHVRLEEIHRQAADNPIIQLAHHILDTGKISRKFSGNNISFGNLSKLDNHLITHGKDHDVIICGTNKKRVSINKTMRKIHGRRSMDHPDLPVMGDEVMCLRNNYRVYPEIYNGDSFTVQRVGKPYIFQEYDYNINKLVSREVIDMCVNGDGTYNLMVDADAWYNGPYSYSKEVNHMDYSYAITCHKSQGSEYDNVCFLDENVSFFLDQQKFRYTAVTRSKDLLTILQ